MGDFNNIRNNDERVGSCYREQGDNSIEELLPVESRVTV